MDQVSSIQPHGQHGSPRFAPFCRRAGSQCPCTACCMVCIYSCGHNTAGSCKSLCTRHCLYKLALSLYSSNKETSSSHSTKEQTKELGSQDAAAAYFTCGPTASETDSCTQPQPQNMLDGAPPSDNTARNSASISGPAPHICRPARPGHPARWRGRPVPLGH